MSLNPNAPMVPYSPLLIDPSPYQDRKEFLGIEELAETIKEQGLLQPLVARVSLKDPSRLELIAGERRLRACLHLKLEAVNVIVHEVSDRVAEELVLIENLQRKDLTPLEEAGGYYRLKNLKEEDGRASYSNEAISERLQVPLNRVVTMLAVRDCPKTMLEAVEAKTVPPSVAALVGRIPDIKAREEATKQILRPNHKDSPLTHAETKELIREHYMVRVKEGCGFDPKDAGLLPVEVTDGGLRVAGGACEDCPWRTGKNPALADELFDAGGKTKGKKGGAAGGIDPWMCTMPACFRRKQTAAWAVVKRQAEESNMTVIEGDAARKLFGGWDHRLTSDVWVEMDSKPGYSDFGNAANSMPTWRKCVAGLKLPMAVAQHPETRKAVYLVKRKEAVDVVKKLAAEAAATPTPAAPAAAASGKEKGKGKAVVKEAQPTLGVAVAKALKEQQEQKAKESAANKAEKERAKLDQLVCHGGLTALMAAVGKKGIGIEEMQLLFKWATKAAGGDGLLVFARWLGLKLPKGSCGGSGWLYQDMIIKHVAQVAESRNAKECFLLVLLVAAQMRYSGSRCDVFQDALKAYGIKKGDLEARAKEELKAGKKGKVKPGQGLIGKDQSVSRGVVRGVENYKCDECGCKVEVPFGQGALACLLPVGQMKCTVHGGEWDRECDKPGWGYHCDTCGVICHVPNMELIDVAHMPQGDFQCHHCGPDRDILTYEPLPADLQKLYVPWKPAGSKPRPAPLPGFSGEGMFGKGPDRAMNVQEFAQELGIDEAEDESISDETPNLRELVEAGAVDGDDVDDGDE